MAKLDKFNGLKGFIQAELAGAVPGGASLMSLVQLFKLDTEKNDAVMALFGWISFSGFQLFSEGMIFNTWVNQHGNSEASGLLYLALRIGIGALAVPVCSLIVNAQIEKVNNFQKGGDFYEK